MIKLKTPISSMTRRRLSALLLTGLFLSTSFQASAALNDALDSMFTGYTAATHPDVYETQRRMGVAGGSYQYRAPVRPINLISLDVPRVRSGCGGISLFGGSFSFINAEQFKQLLRQIGSNAVGYAFQIAISEMCKPCGAVLSSLMDKVSDLNKSFRNTCKISKALVAPFESQIAAAGKSAGDALGVNVENGATDDWFSGMDSISTALNDFMQDAKDTDPTVLPVDGNLVWRMLWRSKADNILGNPMIAPSGSVDAETVEIMINLVGTLIVRTGDDCTASAGTGSTKECKPVPIKGSLTLNQLINPPKDLQIFKCDDTTDEMSCMNMSQTVMAFPGIKAMVHNQLFGHTDVNSYVPAADSLVARVVAGDEPTTAQQSFIRAGGASFYTFMLRLQHQPGGTAQVAQVARDPITNAVAIYIGHAIYKMINDAYSGDDKARIPEGMPERLSDLRRELSDLATATRDDIKKVEALAKYSQVVFDWKSGIANPSGHL